MIVHYCLVAAELIKIVIAEERLDLKEPLSLPQKCI